MKHLHVIFAVLLIVCFAAPAQAQKRVFIKKDKPAAQAETPAEDFPWTVPPETDTPPDPSQKIELFYYNCMHPETETLTPSGREAMCACSAAKVGDILEPEEYDILDAPTIKGQIARDKLLIHVHVPCMQYPAYDLVYGHCISDPSYKKELKNHEAVCECAAQNFAKDFSAGSAEYYSTSLRPYISSRNPIETLASQGLESAVGHHLSVCLYQKEFGVQ